MPTVKQYQKGGTQEKPLGAGHYKTTTGKVVVWGTPEYREAYDRGEVVTDKGVKSPVTVQGGQLKEVVVKNNYKRNLLEQYRDKIIEENKDAGLLGAIIGTPISAITSLPQLFATKAITSKMQRPSEAMNIQNPYGAMAVDAVTDPANLIGAGVLTKEKVLAGLARSTEDGLLSNAYKINPFAFKPNPDAYYRQVFSESIPKTPFVTKTMAQKDDLKGVSEFLNLSEEKIGIGGTDRQLDISRMSSNDALPYFNKSEPYYVYNPFKNNKQLKEFLYENNTPLEDYTDFYPAGLNSTALDPNQVKDAITVYGDKRVLSPFSETGHNIDNYNVYKKDWLQGYKQIQPQFKDGGQKTDKGKYIDAAHVAEQKYGIPRNTLVGLLGAESNFNPNAVSPVGARGIAQFMKGTAQEYGIDPLDPFQSIDAAGKYLSRSYKKFGNWEDSLRSYNLGVGGVEAWKAGKRTLPKETKDYVGRVYKKAGINYEEPSYASSVAPYMNAPQIKEKPFTTIQIPEMQTQQVSYLDTPQETTNLAEEIEAKPSKINPQEEAFMQDLLSQMAEGVGYVEPEKSEVFQDGGKIPVSSEGMYEYPNQPVIIPSSRITMKNIPHSILAVTDQGDRQILQPEEEYQLKGNNTLEISLTKAEENFLKDLYETN